MPVLASTELTVAGMVCMLGILLISMLLISWDGAAPAPWAHAPVAPDASASVPISKSVFLETFIGVLA
jgi:hypothetical protein